MGDELEHRIEALERAVTDGEHDLSAVAEDAAALERLETLESEFETIEDRVAELEAATQALRGYVGNVRSVNEEVEQRADAALSKAETLERELDAVDSPKTTHNGREESEPQTGGEHRSTPAKCEQTSTTAGGEHTSATAEGEHASTTARCEQTSAAADGGMVLETHCEKCGKPRESNQQNDSGYRSKPAHSEQDTDTALVPEETEETGTLQRIRELL